MYTADADASTVSYADVNRDANERASQQHADHRE